MKHIKIYEDFLNEANRSKRGNNKINFLKDSTSDVDHTRLVKWMGQHIDSNKYSFEKSKIVGYWVLDVKKLSERELKDLLQYLDSEKYKFGTEIWLPAYTGYGFESVVYEAKEFMGYKVGDDFYYIPSTQGETRYYKIMAITKNVIKLQNYDFVRNGPDKKGDKREMQAYIFTAHVNDKTIAKYSQGDLSDY